MDLALQVAKDVVPIRTTNVSEALLFAKSLSITPALRTLGDLDFHEAAQVTDKLQGTFKKTRMTRHAVMSLCRILGIPDPFARRIPNDLLLANIRRLQGLHQEEKVVALLRDDLTVAGFVKKKYSEASYVDVLGAIESKENIEYVTIGESLLTVCFSHREYVANDPFSSDTRDALFIGSYLFSSLLATKPLHLRVGLYRSACTNSYVGTALGTLKADYKLPVEVRVLKFAERVGDFDITVVNRFLENMNRMQDNMLYMHELASIWGKLRSCVGPIDADSMIGYTEDSRQQLVDVVNTWKKTNKRSRLLGQSVLDPVTSDRNLFTVLNNATSYAWKELEGMDRFRVENLCGKLMEQFILN